MEQAICKSCQLFELVGEQVLDLRLRNQVRSVFQTDGPGGSVETVRNRMRADGAGRTVPLLRTLREHL